MTSMPASKMWGGKEFWGLSWDYDPQWLLNEEQREIQEKLIETCRAVIRPNAVSLLRFVLHDFYSFASSYRNEIEPL